MIRFAPFALLLLNLASPSVYGQGFGVFFGDEARDFLSEEGSCLADDAVLEALSARGYADVVIQSRDDTYVDLQASRDGVTYQLQFNACSSRIVDIRELSNERTEPLQ